MPSGLPVCSSEALNSTQRSPVIPAGFGALPEKFANAFEGDVRLMACPVAMARAAKPIAAARPKAEA